MSQILTSKVATILGLPSTTIAALAGADRLIRVSPVQSQIATRIDIATSNSSISPGKLDKATLAKLVSKSAGVYAHKNNRLTKVGTRASAKGATKGKLLWNTASFIVVDGDATKAQRAKNKKSSQDLFLSRETGGTAMDPGARGKDSPERGILDATAKDPAMLENRVRVKPDVLANVDLDNYLAQARRDEATGSPV